MNSPPSSPLCADAINEDANLATGLSPFHLPGAMATVILSSPSFVARSISVYLPVSISELSHPTHRETRKSIQNSTSCLLHTSFL